jgi:hypothetical protein
MIAVEIRKDIAMVTMKSYSPRVLETIRTIRGRRWDARRKVWTIPVSTLQGSVERLVRVGELVMVNGREWTGNSGTQQVMTANRVAEIEAENEPNPLTPLFGELPPHLRQPVHHLLANVLAPAAGGDVQWMVLLDQAHSACEEDGSRAVEGRAS